MGVFCGLENVSAEQIMEKAAAAGLREQGVYREKVADKWQAALKDGARSVKVAAALNNNDTRHVYLELVKENPALAVGGLAAAGKAVGAEELVIHLPEGEGRLKEQLEKAAKDGGYAINVQSGLVNRRAYEGDVIHHLATMIDLAKVLEGSFTPGTYVAAGTYGSYGPMKKIADGTKVADLFTEAPGGGASAGETGKTSESTGASAGETGLVSESAGASVGETGMTSESAGAAAGETGKTSESAGASVGETGMTSESAGASVGETPDAVGILKHVKAVEIGTEVYGAEGLEQEITEDTALSCGTVTVVTDQECIVAEGEKRLLKLRKISCGKCTFCREGLFQLHTMTKEISEGKGKAEFLPVMEEIAEAMAFSTPCSVGQTGGGYTLGTLGCFRSEYEAHIKKKKCPADVCKAFLTVYIDPNACEGCEECADVCPADCIEGKAGYIHMIDEFDCTKCGKCIEVCEYGAVVQTTGRLPKLPTRLVKCGKFKKR